MFSQEQRHKFETMKQQSDSRGETLCRDHRVTYESDLNGLFILSQFVRDSEVGLFRWTRTGDVTVYLDNFTFLLVLCQTSFQGRTGNLVFDLLMGGVLFVDREWWRTSSLTYRPTSCPFDVYTVGPSSCHSNYIYDSMLGYSWCRYLHTLRVFDWCTRIYLNGISRLISPGNRDPRHCSLLS